MTAITMPGTLTQLAWAEAVEYSRHSPAILTLAQAIGIHFYRHVRNL